MNVQNERLIYTNSTLILLGKKKSHKLTFPPFSVCNFKIQNDCVWQSGATKGGPKKVGLELLQESNTPSTKLRTQRQPRTSHCSNSGQQDIAKLQQRFLKAFRSFRQSRMF